MVGRDIGDTYANLSRNESFGKVMLEVKNLTTQYLRGVSFRVREGEIVGLAGLVGSGRTEVARALFGVDAVTGGEIIVNGRPVVLKSPGDAIKHGIALCRGSKEQGLVMGHSSGTM